MRITDTDLTSELVAQLPPWGRAAFAARCARRVQPFFAREEIEAAPESLECVDKAILIAELQAANDQVTSQHFQAAEEINSIPRAAKSARAAYAAAAALYCAQAADVAADYVGMFRDRLYDDTITKCTLSAAYAAALAVASPSDAPFRVFDPVLISRAPEDILVTASFAPRNPSKFRAFGRALERDFKLLKEAAQQGSWGLEKPVSRHFFSLRSDFEVEHSLDRGTILEISATLNAKLLEYFRHHPEHLYTLAPRKFEEVIAHLFEEFGFDVELTGQTRDGGKDVIAVRNSPAKLKYLIECKRYARERAVGVSVVRELLGVVVLEKASKGIVATTSRFTKEANEVLDKVPWLLEGRDFDGLVQWLDQYQVFQMAKIRDEP